MSGLRPSGYVETRQAEYDPLWERVKRLPKTCRIAE